MTTTANSSTAIKAVAKVADDALRQVEALQAQIARLQAEAPCYYILRIYKDGGRGQTRVIKRGLTLEQARDHCRDKEAHSSTCTTATGRARTRKSGPWYDTYEQAV